MSEEFPSLYIKTGYLLLCIVMLEENFGLLLNSFFSFVEGGRIIAPLVTLTIATRKCLRRSF